LLSELNIGLLFQINLVIDQTRQQSFNHVKLAIRKSIQHNGHQISFHAVMEPMKT